MTDGTLTDILLRRNHTVFLPTPSGDAATADVRAQLVSKLETELAEFGYLFSAQLRFQLLETELSKQQLTDLARHILEVLATARGANAYHVAQFRQFPRSTPHNTVELYITRVLHWLAQTENAPCLFCGTAGSVSPVRPCGHLICSVCFDGSDHSGCPICHQRIDPDNPFIQAEPQRDPLPASHAGPLVLLIAGTDIYTNAADVASRLLARTSPLAPADRDDLLVLVDALGDDVLSLAPIAGIPVKETQALVYGELLKLSGDPAISFSAFAEELGTATDLLRVLNVFCGGDAGLVEPRPQLKTLPRALRRAVLARLEQLPLERVGEDVQRHKERWLRVGQMLRPFEYHNRFPQTALVFAALRRTKAQGSLDATIANATSAAVADGNADTVVATKTAVKIRTFNSQVEAAFIQSDAVRALELLAARPGDLARRLDHLLRVAGDIATQQLVVDALEAVVQKLPTPLILTLRGQLRRRNETQNRRVFFPRGAVTRPYSLADQRLPLPAEITDRAVSVLSAELSRRADKLDKVPVAVLDEALKDLLVPVAERTASKSLVALPRGSRIPLPSTDGKLRLFLHWMEKDHQRIDLDLSVAFFDADWRVVAECDYTRLRGFYDEPEAAVHSGDLTSAPAPYGASEFVDLNISKLRALGVRHAAMIVFSYNDVPFDHMDEAFAGFMRGRDQRGEIFDARTVEQRFDLTGNSKICIPLLVDIEENVMTWIDVQPSATDGFHAIWRHKGKLSHMCCDLHDVFAGGTRPTLYEVAAIHAGARTDKVHVRRRDGQVSLLERGAGESDNEFTTRILKSNGDAPAVEIALGDGPVFAALVNGDLELPAGSSVYTLRPQLTPDVSVSQLSASDLVSALKS